MRVLAFPQGDRRLPSSRLRLFQYLPILEKKDWHIKILYLRKSQKKMELLKDFLGLFREWFYADTVWIQKRLLPIYVLFFVKLFGKFIIFDFDDAIYLTDNGLISPGINRFNAVIKYADLIIVGNEYLKQTFAKYSNKIVIIPTPVICNDNVINLRKRQSVAKPTLTIGWIGTRRNIKYLLLIEKTMSRLHKRYGNQIRLMICSDGIYEHPVLKTINVKWSFNAEEQVLKDIDIGIMPLLDDDWTKGKCGFKALLYMANGIPCIVSPVGMNSKIVENRVTGFLASTDDGWYFSFLTLIDDEATRRKMGKAGYYFVKKNYSVEVLVTRLIEAFEGVLL